jgi:hypothetical protein
VKKRRSHEATVNKEKATPDYLVDNTSHHDNNIAKKKKENPKAEGVKAQREKKTPKKEAGAKERAKHKPQKPESDETAQEPTHQEAPQVSSPLLHLSRLSPTEARNEYLRSVAREHRITKPIGSPAVPIATFAITSTLRSVPPETPVYHDTPVTTLQSLDTPAQNPTKKLEHLPLQSLLAMASNISVGHGRYLRKEFEQSHIDREGLIKILKARAKGKSLAMEYRKQTERFRPAKASPEFLTLPLEHSSSPDDNNPDTGTTLPSNKVESQEISKPSTAEEMAAPLMPPTQPQTHKNTVKWLVITLIACLLLATTAFFLFF